MRGLFPSGPPHVAKGPFLEALFPRELEIRLRIAAAELPIRVGIERNLVTLVLQALGTREGRVRNLPRQTPMHFINPPFEFARRAVRKLAALSREKRRVGRLQLGAKSR